MRIVKFIYFFLFFIFFYQKLFPAIEYKNNKKKVIVRTNDHVKIEPRIIKLLIVPFIFSTS